jgi:GH15 family glucan-1,4-alpha-glucosidase
MVRRVMVYLPIEDHGIIGNLYTAALVGTDGTVDWLCLPSFDSPSVFASILDEEKGGHFKLAPAEYERRQQLYLPDTNVLVTRFLSARGIAEVTDFMSVGEEEGRPRLIREVRVTRGSLDIEVDCRPAFDYGRQDHELTLSETGAVFEGAGMPLGLATGVPL